MCKMVLPGSWLLMCYSIDTLTTQWHTLYMAYNEKGEKKCHMTGFDKVNFASTHKTSKQFSLSHGSYS